MEGACVAPLGGGLINATFVVDAAAGRFVLQRLHAVFQAQIHDNIVAVTERLAAAGIATPRLVPSRDDAPYATRDDGVWRVQTLVEGVSHDAADSPARVRAAGNFLARFHSALDGIDHTFVGLRTGVHDTARHLATLRRLVDTHASHRLHAEVAGLADAIEARAAELPPLSEIPPRIVHGDPKLNNFLFAGDDPPTVRCLVDLDTVAPMGLALELGDAWRSWCNRAGEDQPEAEFDLALFDASLRGYVDGCTLSLSPAEREGLGYGLDWITLELAARFAADALAESYFGWDPSRYPSAGAHNLVRARGQWSLHEAAFAQTEARVRLCAARLG
jgi:Ser/Thr protein kinase RdoA (MazF antagonist)